MKIAYIGLVHVNENGEYILPYHHITLEFFKGNTDREKTTKKFLSECKGIFKIKVKNLGITEDLKMGAYEMELPQLFETYFKGIIPHLTLFANAPYTRKEAWKCFFENSSVHPAEDLYMYFKPVAFGYDNKPIE